MSSISISGASLYQFFQSVSGNSATQATSGTTPASDASGQSSTQQVEGGHHHHHGNGGEFKKIADAVTSALQSAQSNPSADPNQVIQDAIAKVLEGQSSSSTASTTGANGQVQATGSDPDGDGDTDAPGQADSDTATGANGASGGRQAFFQMLQQMGVDPQQFHKDFLAAIQEAQNGQVNPNTAFQSFPPGTTVDTTA